MMSSFLMSLPFTNDSSSFMKLNPLVSSLIALTMFVVANIENYFYL